MTRGHSEPVVRLKGVRGSPHPWVWRTSIDREWAPHDLPGGSVVRIVDGEGQPVGRGHWHPKATIALRVLTNDAEEEIDEAFYARRLARALVLRRDVLRLDEITTAYRLCHAEADGLSGLIVDVLGDVVVGEVFSLGMAKHEALVRSALAQLFPGKRILLQHNERAGSIEGFALRPKKDDPGEVEVQEHGVRYKVDLREGHKTGFFCDQRDNRAALAAMCRGRSVWDLHTYTGGFALNAALRGEAKQVTACDLDEKALAVAKKNAKLNQVQGNLRFAQADAFAYLRDLQRTGQRPEVLILDPPKLARDRSEVEDARRIYADLNRLALEVIAEDGILLTCSCSGSFSEEDLLDALRRGAAKTRREVTILRIAGAAPDHPVALHIPESRYLKAIFARVRSL
jgi:23S rRNA (cytosine1962-C5)-methyltransferase